jgi:hypothetical protein
MKNCLDEATLQAYLDGELSAERTSAAAAHVHACASCATAAREASQEFVMFATAFGADEQLSVPTERLRAGIEARIAGMQPNRAATRDASVSFVERVRAFAASLGARIAFTPRQATAFASFLVAAILLATIFYVFRTPSHVPQSDKSGREIASASSPTDARGGAVQSNNEEKTAGTSNKQSGNSASEPVRVDDERRTQRSERAAIVATRFNESGRALGGNSERVRVEKPADEALLPVEKSYVVAIASLKSSLDAERARTMTPTLRAEYERNLALVDRAISASRVAARRDPSDKDAQEFLRAAYQDKLDLLHAVADQTQIASIAR